MRTYVYETGIGKIWSLRYNFAPIIDQVKLRMTIWPTAKKHLVHYQWLVATINSNVEHIVTTLSTRHHQQLLTICFKAPHDFLRRLTCSSTVLRSLTILGWWAVKCDITCNCFASFLNVWPIWCHFCLQCSFSLIVGLRGSVPMSLMKVLNFQVTVAVTFRMLWGL